jgi:YfiH family protein
MLSPVRLADEVPQRGAFFEMPGNIADHDQPQIVPNELPDDRAGNAGLEAKKIVIETFDRHAGIASIPSRYPERLNGFHWNQRGELSAGLLEEIDWLDHGFGTRNSPPPGWPIATVKQIHSADVIDAAGFTGERGSADALVSNAPGLAVGVRTADCLPILLVDPEHRAVAAVHAGWRGTAARIVERTISRLHEMYGTNPDQLRAAIGPGIGKCCFEVGPEVARQFSPWHPDLEATGSKHRLDLVDINHRQLRGAGVEPANIASSDLCTMDRTDILHSFRKEREHAGRMLAWIAIR